MDKIGHYEASCLVIMNRGRSSYKRFQQTSLNPRCTIYTTHMLEKIPRKHSIQSTLYQVSTA
ncbi:MAG TPA: hypothetical protein VE619_11895, partial [Nitrososphaeraceae archaeon]|nr:hypothetical protein [Nitrososphaeraceae archaeon]